VSSEKNKKIIFKKIPCVFVGLWYSRSMIKNTTITPLMKEIAAEVALETAHLEAALALMGGSTEESENAWRDSEVERIERFRDF
jgi:uncharacterized protein YqfA (UPF0365 family)